MYLHNALSGAVRTPMSLAVLAALAFGFTVQCAWAQEVPRTPRIGILSPYSAEGSTFEDDVRRGLIELGYVEGQSIDFEVVFADGRTDQLSILASELVREDVDLIVTTTAPGVRAAKQATSVVPIIIGGVDDAVEQGFVDSLAEPGGNVTGTSWLNAELSAKRLDLLKQALPEIASIGVLREAVGGGASARAVLLAAQHLGIQVYLWELRAPNELDDVFLDMARMEVAGLNVLQSPMITSETTRIVGLASKNRLAAIFPDRRFIEAGGLMSYGPDLPSMYRRAAVYVHRILKGAKPAELPVEQPTFFELVVNLRTARLQGLSLQESILVRADEVIE